MGLSFFVFGASSLNLFFLLKANTALILEHGWMALADGGAAQLVELLVTGYISMLAYLVFKACEYSLVHGLLDHMMDHKYAAHAADHKELDT